MDLGILASLSAEISAATLPAWVLLSLLRWAWPTAPRWAIVAFALAVAEGASFLVMVFLGHEATSQHVAAHLLSGVFAAGAVVLGRTIDARAMLAVARANGDAVIPPTPQDVA